MRLTIDATPMEGEELKERRKGWGGDLGATHWKVILQDIDTGRTIGPVSYSMGSAHRSPPEARQVLEALISDAECGRDDTTFEEFCANLGYDEDSRKAERDFKACQKTNHDIAEFLGEKEARRAMILGGEEYCRLLFDGEDIQPRNEYERVLPWHEFVHRDRRHRVCLHFGVDVAFGMAHTQDPSISAQTHVQEWDDELGVWRQGWVDNAESFLPPEEQALERLHLCGVLTGPMHYVANSLYRYKMMIGVTTPSDSDISRWKRDFPDAANPTGMGAERSFKRCCAYGVVDPEPPFPAVVEEGAAAPLPADELVENMQVWLEQRLPCLVHAIHAKIAEVGLPLDEIVKVAEEIQKRRVLRGPPRKQPPPAKLIHTITEEDVSPPPGTLRRRDVVILPECKHCAGGPRRVFLPHRLTKKDVGKRVYQCFDDDGKPSVVQIESDGQLKRRMERRKGVTA